jgi:hypothetical protein
MFWQESDDSLQTLELCISVPRNKYSFHINLYFSFTAMKTETLRENFTVFALIPSFHNTSVTWVSWKFFICVEIIHIYLTRRWRTDAHLRLTGHRGQSIKMCIVHTWLNSRALSSVSDVRNWLNVWSGSVTVLPNEINIIWAWESIVTHSFTLYSVE